MAFISRLPDIVPGHGSPAQDDTLFLHEGIVLSTNNPQLNYVPGTAGLRFVPPLVKGKIRVKFTAVSGTSPAITEASFVLDDAAIGGTNYTEVGNVVSQVMAPVQGGSTLTPLATDRVFEFEIDFCATRLGISTTLGGTTPVVLMDVEISGTTGKPALAPA